MKISKPGVREGVHFLSKWCIKGKGLDLKAEPSVRKPF